MDKLLSRLDGMAESGLLRTIDAEFARYVAAGGAPYELVLAALVASYQLGQNHSCADLAALAAQPELIAASGIKAPPLADWLDILRGLERVGQPGDKQAFILDGHLFYLARYFDYEDAVAEGLLARARSMPVDEAALLPRLDYWFPPLQDEIDWQRVAAVLALSRQLSVITGGPGTGKTTTVLRILALLLEHEDVQIKLVAPTGKAATRLSDAIKGALSRYPDEAVPGRIPTEVATIHRLLGSRPGTLACRHHAANPLALDVLVVDEASMVDLPMMARLLDALPNHARLVLLGDKDQLPAVEAGNLLADISRAAGLDDAQSSPNYSTDMAASLDRLCGLPLASTTAAVPPLSDSVCLLRRSYRFAPDSSIGQLGAMVNRGDSQALRQLLGQGDYQADLELRAFDAATAYAQLAEPYVAWIEALPGMEPLAAIAALDNYRVMCALRDGPYGVETVNQRIEQDLKRRGLLTGDSDYYLGRPLMVVENDYGLGLFNGDVGIVLPGPMGTPVACFVGREGELRRVLPSRLPAHVSCFAMTVHKSQGSEFDHAALLLPAKESGKLSPILTRELLYTGITRARKKLTLVADIEVLAAACEQQVERASGLPARLAANPELTG